MPSGGTLRIAVRTDGRPGGVPMPEEALRSERYAVLSVSDGGIGIAPEILPQIFHPFFTTKPVGQGTGLGLATVYGIVMQLGGTVRVQSKVGHGATFDIYIPFDEHAQAEQEVAATTAVQPDGDGRTVLLAEDEPGLRKLSERVLSEAGYRVLVAADGAAALGVSRAHAGPIDLLITDVVMPGLGGVDLAAALRKERPSIRVLLVSGYPRSTTSPADAALAQLPFLAKPFLPGELRAAAAQALADG
jgi:CheY-like chemotaxis protein